MTDPAESLRRLISDMAAAEGWTEQRAADFIAEMLRTPAIAPRAGICFTHAQRRAIDQAQRDGNVEEAQRLILAEVDAEFGRH